MECLWAFYIWFILLIIVLLGWIYIMIWQAGINSFRALLISFGTSKRRGVDISELKPVPPDNLRPNIVTLENLGFRRLGEVQVKLPTFSSPIRGWVFVSSDGLTFAEVTEAWSKMVGFSTAYSDNASLETIFPMGERINMPNFRSHTITTDIEKAYQHHIQQIIDFGKAHPAPRIIKSIEDYIEWGDTYRKLYAKRKNLRLDLGHLINFISLVYGIVVTMAIIISYICLHILTAESLFNLITTLFLAIAPAIFITYASVRTTALMSQRESKSA